MLKFKKETIVTTERQSFLFNYADAVQNPQCKVEMN